MQPNVVSKSQCEKVLFAASAYKTGMWDLESARTWTAPLPWIKGQLWQGGR